MPHLLSCQACGTSFSAKRSDARFCLGCRGLRRSRAYEERQRQPCPDCGVWVTGKSKRCRKCAGKYRNISGAANPNWKGGRTRHSNGYVQVRAPRDGHHPYRLEHIVVWEQANGPIPRGYVIHHLNGVKDDNRLGNLVAVPRASHGPRAHADPAVYEARIRALEARIRELEVI